MANSPAILAGVGGKSLAWFAPENTAGPVASAGTAGVQTVTETGTPTGGTFTLTWNGNTTAPIAYNATAAVVASALQALPGGSSITTSGGPLPTTAVTVTFPATINQSTMTANSSGLTGGTTPAVAVAQTTPGTQAANEATATIPTGFLDAGWCSDAGLVKKINEQSKEVFAYGTTSPVRTLISQQSKAFDITFLESNPTSLAVANRLPLTAITADSSGLMKFNDGPAQLPRYAAIFDIVDGANHIRQYCPSVAASTVSGWTAAPASTIDYPVTLTAYPDSNGNAIYNYVLVDALKH